MANIHYTGTSINAVMMTRTRREPGAGDLITETVVVAAQKAFSDASLTPKENDFITYGGVDYLVKGIEEDPLSATYTFPVVKI